ncbi:MAG: thiamine pyrophosphate-dependent enzyme [Pirellulaceae bacterium]|nr:thiamine pyrophosphate-dependent enzyme [Pirellulaceae bacterium]
MSKTAPEPHLTSGGEPLESVRGNSSSIGEYLIKRLQDYGIGHVFGIPGDYVLQFYGMLEESPLTTVGCTREDCAGFAADAYARIRGMGALCVTYCVGGLSVCNAIAGAYAEKSPVVLLTGSPGLGERINDPLLHHKVRDFRTQIEVFEKLCIAGSELSNPLSAFREIDRVLDAVARFKRPGYLDIPRDMVHVIPEVAQPFPNRVLPSDPEVVSEAVDEAARLLAAAKKPIILAGVEVHRFGLQDRVLALAEGSNIPIAATLLGKSVIRETHPLYIGLYEGAMGREAVTRYVEGSDCVLLLGTFMTDLNLGVYSANLDAMKCIYATSEELRIHHHHYHNVLLEDFVKALVNRKVETQLRAIPSDLHPQRPEFQLKVDQKLTIQRMIARLNQQIDENIVVIADIGYSLFAATELLTHARTDFISPAYYTSMGYSIPATLGALFARPDDRPLVLCGDGAFQMTGMELSTIARHGLAPIIIVLDNHGYGTERVLHPGEWEYNEIHPWKYHKLPEVLGSGTGYLVRTEGEFDEALNKAWQDNSGFSLLHVHVDRDDYSETLNQMAERLGPRV